MHSEFKSLSRVSFRFRGKSKYQIEEWQHNPQQLNNLKLEQILFCEFCKISSWAFILRENPCNQLKSCKKWVWNTFERIFFPFYKHFMIMQCSVSQKRPQQIYMTLCSNLQTIPELYHKTVTFSGGNFSQVFSIWGEISHLRASANAQKT